MVVSAIVAGFAGIAVVIKLGFRRFLSLFSPKQRAALREEKAAREKAQELEAQQDAASQSATAPSTAAVSETSAQ
jgi:hypothetical protein